MAKLGQKWVQVAGFLLVSSALSAILDGVLGIEYTSTRMAIHDVVHVGMGVCMGAYLYRAVAQDGRNG